MQKFRKFNGIHSIAQALELEPENKATLNQITLCKHEIRKQTAEDQRRYRTMMRIADIENDQGMK